MAFGKMTGQNEPMPFLTSNSVNAIVSDLRPTTVAPATLHHINLFLDELMSSLIYHAQSINPADLRTTGIPAVFSGDKAAGESTGPRTLGRAAVGEAEMELRTWYEQNSGARKGFPPGGKGRGMIESQEQARFPEREAVELMRLKCASFSTLAPEQPYSDEEESSTMAAWKGAGGDTSPTTVDPAGLWMTAIIEHVCEHVLQQLSSVVARDSSVAVANVQDLLTCLYEDETVYGFFKRMKVKDSLEEAIKSGTTRKRGPSSTTPETARTARSSTVTTPHNASKTSLSSATTPPTSYKRDLTGSPQLRKHAVGEGRGSSENSRFGGIGRKLSMRKDLNDQGAQGQERTPSVLSVNTKSILGAFNESFESTEHSPQQDQDEFDALVRSGETMKVSLTPSRLKTFEVPSPKKSGQQSGSRSRRTRAALGDDSSPVPPLPLSMSSGSLNGKLTNPTRPGSNSRGQATTPRLIARGATTIDEATDETDGEGILANKPKKESLKELFGSEPSPPPDKTIERSVPAVILGTPPPPDSQFEATRTSVTSPSSRPVAQRRTSPSKPSVNRPDRYVENMDDEDDFSPVKSKKSENRELADFLANTPPPPASYNRQTVLENPPSAKSNKSFRTFMSKFTGNKKDGEDDSSAKQPKRVRSSASVSVANSTFTTQTVPDGGSRRGWEAGQARPMPISDAWKKKAEVAGGVGGVAAVTGALAVEKAEKDKREDATAKEKDELPPIPSEIVEPQVSANTDQPIVTEPAILTSPPKRSTSIGKANGHTTVKELQTVQRSTTPPAPPPEPTASRPSNAETTHSALMDRTQTTASDANSFTTADEGVDDRAVPAVENPQLEEQPSTTATVQQELPTSPTGPVTPAALPPSIPLSKLIPLRGLLDHATSPGECRMLLSAILTQLGVPFRSDEEDQTTPESRVMAWLLAGGYGPVHLPPSQVDSEEVSPTAGDVGGKSEVGAISQNESGSTKVEEAGEKTPTLQQDDKLQSTPLPAPPQPTGSKEPPASQSGKDQTAQEETELQEDIQSEAGASEISAQGGESLGVVTAVAENARRESAFLVAT